MAKNHTSRRSTPADKAEKAAVAPRPLVKLEDHADQMCRICHDEADLENGPLLQPCRCKGTIAFVHKCCLEDSLRVWGDMCTVCCTRIEMPYERAPLWRSFRDFVNWEEMLCFTTECFVMAIAMLFLAIVVGAPGWIAVMLVFAVLFLILSTCSMIIAADK
ncbi:hypothetical protein MRX96_041997 [Rhipicephalus microplus]